MLTAPFASIRAVFDSPDFQLQIVCLPGKHTIQANEIGQASVTDQKLSPEGVKNTIFLGRSGDKGSYVGEIEPVEGLPILFGKNANEFIHQGSIRDGRHGTFTVKKNDL